MKNEDQWFIRDLPVWICREGRGIVSDHISHAEHPYHKVSGSEVRYVIQKANGIDSDPRLNYHSPLQRECIMAGGVVTATRLYLREIDRTYFKYLDDAEEVLNNIISFIQWLKNPPSKLTVKQIKKIHEENHHLIKDVPSSPEWERMRASPLGFPVKRRDQLSPFVRHLQDELDLLPGSH